MEMLLVLKMIIFVDVTVFKQNDMRLGLYTLGIKT